MHVVVSLSLIGARFYHAQLGRFISRDPLGYADGLSLYRAYFVPGGVDPTGLEVVCPACTSSVEYSRGGDDRVRDYETARITVALEADTSECSPLGACNCFGEVVVYLSYSAKIKGQIINPALAHFGILYNGTFFKFDFIQGNMKPNDWGVLKLKNKIKLGTLDCELGTLNGTASVVTFGQGGPGPKPGKPLRIAEVITFKNSTGECGDWCGEISMVELPTGAGQFAQPLRNLTCGEEPYPEWEPNK